MISAYLLHCQPDSILVKRKTWGEQHISPTSQRYSLALHSFAEHQKRGARFQPPSALKGRGFYRPSRNRIRTYSFALVLFNHLPTAAETVKVSLPAVVRSDIVRSLFLYWLDCFVVLRITYYKNHLGFEHNLATLQKFSFYLWPYRIIAMEEDVAALVRISTWPCRSINLKVEEHRSSTMVLECARLDVRVSLRFFVHLSS